jgi:multiple sugar transport system permease protein
LLTGYYEVKWNYLFAGSLIAIIPVVILFIFIEKYLVSGLTAGSVK